MRVRQGVEATDLVLGGTPLLGSRSRAPFAGETPSGSTAIKKGPPSSLSLQPLMMGLGYNEYLCAHKTD